MLRSHFTHSTSSNNTLPLLLVKNSLNSKFSATSLPQAFTAKRNGLSHNPSNNGLSNVTVQFSMFCSTPAVDVATGLPFPYHIQRLLDNEVASIVNVNQKQKNLSSLKMAPDQFKFWVDDRWATEIKKCARAAASVAVVGDEKNDVEVDKEPTKKSKTSASSNSSGKNNNNKKSSSSAKKTTKDQPAESTSSSSKSSNQIDRDKATNDSGGVQVSPWKFSASSSSSSATPNAANIINLRHVSNFSVSPEQLKEYQEAAAAATKSKSTGGYSSQSNSNNATFEAEQQQQQQPQAEQQQQQLLTAEELLLKLLRCRSGAPRCGQTGNFFTRQDLAFSLAVSAEINGYKSPFWISSTHPGLTQGAKRSKSSSSSSSSSAVAAEPHLVIRPEEIDRATLASASLIVFPAKRLGFSESAAQSALSAEFLKLRGTKDVCGMNAISGIRLGSGKGDDSKNNNVPSSQSPTSSSSSSMTYHNKAALDFFASHPDFEKDGWVSFDQIMKLGLPILSPIGKGGPASVPLVPDDIFDGGILVEILKDVAFYNQEQLERPGKLAMKRMPGAPPPLLDGK